MLSNKEAENKAKQLIKKVRGKKADEFGAADLICDEVISQLSKIKKPDKWVVDRIEHYRRAKHFIKNHSVPLQKHRPLSELFPDLRDLHAGINC